MSPGENESDELQTLESLVALIRGKLATRDQPLVIGIDGRSGVGKSTLAAAIAWAIDDVSVAVIEGDDFYGGGSQESYDSRTPAENSARVIDWRRQRNVVDQLLHDGVAEWHPFDWDSDSWETDIVPFSATPVSVETSDVIILEGVYSCRPELYDLLDIKVLLVAPEDVRMRQLIQREGDGDQGGWVARWSAAEDHYFAHNMPPSVFDWIVQIQPA